MGKYLEADPLGLVDGASVYGYAGGNPGRWIDPRGEDTAWGGDGPISIPVPLWPGETYPGELGGSMLDLSRRYNPIDLALQKLFEFCSSCPACRSASTGQLVPLGASGHRYAPSSRGHWPYIDGEHVHLYKASQNPNNCQCFWDQTQKLPVAPPPPEGSLDITKHPLVTMWGQ
jgi:uncharacterized protein RhaS with RHS repeats